VTVALANDLVRAAPFDRLDAVERVPGMTPAILSAMREMAAAMERLRAATVEDQAVNRLRRVVLFAAERAAAWLCVAAALGAMAYGLVRRLRFVRLALDGMAAALLVLGLSWIVDTDPAWTLFAPLAAFGVPAALWLLAYRRAPREALRAIAAWTMTAVPAWLIAHPLF
jgi:hypothetical protein